MLTGWILAIVFRGLQYGSYFKDFLVNTECMLEIVSEHEVPSENGSTLRKEFSPCKPLFIGDNIVRRVVLIICKLYIS